MHEHLKDFMVKLASDVDALTEFISDAQTVIGQSDLSDEERNILRSGDQDRIYQAISEPQAQPAPAQPQPPAPAPQQFPQPAASWPQQAPGWGAPQPAGWPAAYAHYAIPATGQQPSWPHVAYAIRVPWILG
ncbi:MAG TPA: hypothetical protein VJ276_20290 [Thermoanaerobaculia bacterium]|nr:hypothetical protein [Thermoanaerobaculia bacterium]